jgi:hypothetical protein
VLKHWPSSALRALRANFLMIKKRNHHRLIRISVYQRRKRCPTRNLIVYPRRSDEFRIFTEDLSLLRVNQLRRPLGNL